MPTNAMDWAKLIGVVIGGTITALAFGWQVWLRVGPYLKRMDSEITGGADVKIPGIRAMLQSLTEGQREGTRAANNLAEAVGLMDRRLSKEQSVLRDTVDGIERDLSAFREETRSSAQRQGERIGEHEKAIGRLEGRVDTIEKLHVERGCVAAHAVTEGGQGPAGAGADRSEILDPQPPRGRTVSPAVRPGKDKAV